MSLEGLSVCFASVLLRDREKPSQDHDDLNVLSEEMRTRNSAFSKLLSHFLAMVPVTALPLDMPSDSLPNRSIKVSFSKLDDMVQCESELRQHLKNCSGVSDVSRLDLPVFAYFVEFSTFHTKLVLQMFQCFDFAINIRLTS